jgi:predicted HTH transcriptional regulator
VTRDHLEQLVNDGVPESQVLDHKSTPESDREELAKDIAAMANAGGGVIVYGVSENRSGGSHELADVDISDAEERRIRQIAYGRIHPYPAFAFHSVAGDGPGTGNYILHVEGSEGSPHAVSTNREALLFVIRDGTLTRPMREPEVAQRYRDRFRQAQQQVDRLETVWEEGCLRVPQRHDVLVGTGGLSTGKW